MEIPLKDVDAEELAEQAMAEALDEYGEELSAVNTLEGSAPPGLVAGLRGHYEERVAEYAHVALAEYAVNIKRDEEAAGSLAVVAAGKVAAMMHDLAGMDPSLMSVEPLAWEVRRGARALED